ncbi:hypothetical protein [Microbacterium sp.]|uniref:hypothetical protein n=1 Tax=Microbacterium sp. TaxID=51671 RepID=UPI003F6FB72B
MKRIVGAFAVAIVAAAGLVAVGPSASQADAPRDVGIWYATWYSKVTAPPLTWRTGFGGSSTNQFAADVSGDGKADAITFTAGTWDVATSSGTAFNTPSAWRTGHGSGSTTQLVADVNGDNRADAIAFFTTDVSGDGLAGDWYVALSNGSSFNNYSLWKSGLGGGATRVLLADITGDGKSDALGVYGSTGQWVASTSSGSAFGSVSTWATGLGTSATDYFAADVNKDGRADAAAYNGGTWTRSLSTGTAFGTSATLTSGHGVGSAFRFLADGNGDGFAEPYAFFNSDLALPTADGQPGDLVAREYDRASKAIDGGNSLINSGFGNNAGRIMMAPASGDAYGWRDLIAFYPGTSGGTWQVQRYRAADSVSLNTWQGFAGKPAIKYLPYTLGSYQQYDSGNNAVIDEHIATIAGAQIDWLLLDETNGLNNVSGAIINRAARVANRLSVWNANAANRDLKYAFAIGGVQWTNDPVTIENEARQTWEEFANNSTYGDDYYQVGGKPLLVVYTNKSNQAAWQSYAGDKSATNHFTVRFASSDPNATAGEYGWQLPSTGTVDNANVMVAMPGWNNHISGYTPVLRDKGTYYTTKVWDVILNRSPLPNSVVINSFNEFAEDTGMQVSDTSQLASTSEKWFNASNVLQPDLYWDLTVDYIQQYKSAP